MYFKGQSLYPFGFGLSYTTFDYSNLRTSADSVNAAGEINVSVDVKNTGSQPGDKVAQMYVKHLDSITGLPMMERPIKELRGFQRIPLRPDAAERNRADLLRRGQADLRGGTRPPHHYVGHVGRVVR